MKEKIKERARLLHDIEVNQKYDTHPYSYHLFSVASIAEEYMKSYFGLEEDSDLFNALYFAACFHDSIEDARLTYNDVKKIAADFIKEEKNIILATEIVYALTNEKGRNRDERANDKYYSGIRHTSYAPFLKLCDRYANMLYSKETGSRMLDVYKRELPEFLEHIKVDRYLPIDLLNKIREL